MTATSEARIPTADDVSRARRILAETNGHSCIHCEYSDCATTAKRDACWDIIGAHATGKALRPADDASGILVR